MSRSRDMLGCLCSEHQFRRKTRPSGSDTYTVAKLAVRVFVPHCHSMTSALQIYNVEVERVFPKKGQSRMRSLTLRIRVGKLQAKMRCNYSSQRIVSL